MTLERWQVEDVLSGYPELQQCRLMCFPAPHEQLGECVGLAILPPSGYDLSLVCLRRYRQYCRDALKSDHLPQVLVITDELPATVTGKLQRLKFPKHVQLPICVTSVVTYSWKAGCMKMIRSSPSLGAAFGEIGQDTKGACLLDRICQMAARLGHISLPISSKRSFDHVSGTDCHLDHCVSSQSSCFSHCSGFFHLPLSCVAS